MTERIKASLESQLGGAVCEAEDTEEMFWLRQTDDYQSKVALGNALSAQYRFREAAEAYRQAGRIRQDDSTLFLRLGGALLTLREFEDAKEAYEEALRLGASEKAASYPLGVWHYLRGEYGIAARRFGQCLPCDDEMAIAVLYWHALCCLRQGQMSTLLREYRPDMQVGHHTAYRDAVALFAGKTTAEAAAEKWAGEKDSLNRVIIGYGIGRFLFASGERERGKAVYAKVLACKDVWPCISYLAAWNDVCGENGREAHDNINRPRERDA